MTQNIIIKNFDSLETISLHLEIKSIEHYSNQRQLFNYLLTKKYKEFDLELEQLILIEFDIKILIETETEELILKYQVVLERNCKYFSIEVNNNSEIYKKFIVRLTSLSDLKNRRNKTLFETVVRLLESQNKKFTLITFNEFSYFDANSLIKFEFETCKFGLFICNYHHSHTKYLVEKNEYSFENDKSNTIKKIILSAKFPEHNTYVVNFLPSPRINLYDKALPPITEGFESKMDYRRDFYDNRKSQGFIEGTYIEISALFRNEDALRKIVSDYIRQEQN